MLTKVQSYIKNLFNPDKTEQEAQEQKTSELQNKANNVFGTTANNTNNPFLKKDGSLVNPRLDYQKLLDSSNVSQKAKSYITQATGLQPTYNALNSSSNNNTSVNSGVFFKKASDNDSGTSSSSSYDDRGIGFVSAKYESGGNGGSVSTGSGDAGGVSYGISQFASKTGSADSFISWLKQSNPDMASAFKNYKAGTTEFSNAWKQTFSKYGDTFTKVQQQYTYDNYVKKLADAAKKKTGIDYNRSTALRELIYSTAIQFGPYDLGLSALGNVTSDMTDEEIINASYDKKISNYKNYFKSSSASVQEGVKNRFIKEREDVLGLLS